MAGIHFQPPEKFNFKQLNEWPHWLRRFEQFCIVLDLVQKPSMSSEHVTVLPRGEGEDLLRSTQGESKEYSSV